MATKSIKKNTVFSVLKTGSSILFPLITFPYISRTLLAENVGKVNFGLSIVSYFSMFASLGISTYAIRECSAVKDNKERLSNISSQIFSINIITTVLAYLALFITILCWRKLDDYRFLITVQSLTILASTLGADWLNSAMEDFKYITLRTVFFQAFSLVLMFVFVHQPDDYIKYAFISLLSSAGASIFNIWYRRRYCKVYFILKIEWKRHMIPIFYLFVMVLAQTIFNSVDVTMLGSIHGDYEVGIYSTAHKIFNIINQVVGSVLWVIMPRMSFYFSEKNYFEVNKLLRKVFGFNLIFGFPCAVGCFTLAKDIILAVAGDSYFDAVPILRILMIGLALSLIGGNFLGNAILLPSKKERYYMIVCCITAFFNIIGNYIFIPDYGAKAAAWTTTASSFLILVLLLFKVDKQIHIDNVIKLIVSPVCGCVTIILICVLCRLITHMWLRLTLSILFSSLAYACVQVVFKNELVTSILVLFQKKLVTKDE